MLNFSLRNENINNKKQKQNIMTHDRLLTSYIETTIENHLIVNDSWLSNWKRPQQEYNEIYINVLNANKIKIPSTEKINNLFFTALSYCDEDLVRTMLNCGLDINIRDNVTGYNAIEYAFIDEGYSNGGYSITRLLIESGIDCSRIYPKLEIKIGKCVNLDLINDIIEENENIHKI